jgi:hypothetical protein
MTSQCCPTTSTRSSTSLLIDAESNDSTPRFDSTKAQPARRSESREEPRESWPGIDVDKCAAFRKLAPLDCGRSVGDDCDTGKCKIIVIAYMGLRRAWAAHGGLGTPGLFVAEGKGKPLPLGRELWGVGVRASCSSSGIVTENMRVMKMVRRLGSLGTLSLESLRGSSVGALPGVKDLAKLLLLRKPSARPNEPIASWRPVVGAGVSAGLVSRGTM